MLDLQVKTATASIGDSASEPQPCNLALGYLKDLVESNLTPDGCPVTKKLHKKASRILAMVTSTQGVR